MRSKWWIKLWIETLDDGKVGRLDDHLWRRWMECLLLAGDEDAEGWLPDMQQMAWRLRTTEAAPSICCDCGNEVELVRPGKWQCNYCEGAELMREQSDTALHKLIAVQLCYVLTDVIWDCIDAIRALEPERGEEGE